MKYRNISGQNYIKIYCSLRKQQFDISWKYNRTQYVPNIYLKRNRKLSTLARLVKSFPFKRSNLQNVYLYRFFDDRVLSMPF